MNKEALLRRRETELIKLYHPRTPQTVIDKETNEESVTFTRGGALTEGRLNTPVEPEIFDVIAAEAFRLGWEKRDAIVVKVKE